MVSVSRQVRRREARKGPATGSLTPGTRLTSYKFFSSKFLKNVESGTMRIGTASDFRGKEGEDSSGRSDERELYDIWKPGEGEVRMRSDHPFIRRMRAPFDPSSLEDVEHSFIFEADTSFHFLADTYMFCVSMSKGPEVCRRMLDEFNADMYCKGPIYVLDPNDGLG